MRRFCLLARFAATIAVLCGPVARAAFAQGKDLDGVVNLNTAPAELLELLPGVGPAKVLSIIVYRQRRPFRTVDELVRIKGIGRKMVRRLRAHLAVSGPTTARAVHHARGTEAPAPPPPPPPSPVRPPARASPAPVKPAAGVVHHGLPPPAAAGRPRPRATRAADPPAAANHCARPR